MCSSKIMTGFVLQVDHTATLENVVRFRFRRPALRTNRTSQRHGIMKFAHALSIYHRRTKLRFLSVLSISSIFFCSRFWDSSFVFLPLACKHRIQHSIMCHITTCFSCMKLFAKRSTHEAQENNDFLLRNQRTEHTQNTEQN